MLPTLNGSCTPSSNSATRCSVRRCHARCSRFCSTLRSCFTRCPRLPALRGSGTQPVDGQHAVSLARRETAGGEALPFEPCVQRIGPEVPLHHEVRDAYA